MKRTSKYFSSLALAAVLLTAVFMAGCAPAKKPVPDRVNQPAPAPTTPAPLNPLAVTPQVVPTPNNQGRAADAAADISRKVAGINGVNKAYVVVVGNVALIGTDLKDTSRGAETERIKAEAAKRAKEDPRIVNTVVETDPDAVTRINNIAKGIASGRPISEFFTQINEFFTRAKPVS